MRYEQFALFGDSEIQDTEKEETVSQVWDGSCPKCGNILVEPTQYESDNFEALVYYDCSDAECGAEWMVTYEVIKISLLSVPVKTDG